MATDRRPCDRNGRGHQGRYRDIRHVSRPVLAVIDSKTQPEGYREQEENDVTENETEVIHAFNHLLISQKVNRDAAFAPGRGDLSSSRFVRLRRLRKCDPAPLRHAALTDFSELYVADTRCEIGCASVRRSAT